MLDAQIVVIAKTPVAGRVKTRLCPPLTSEQAAAVARAALLDTLDVVTQVPVRGHVVALDGSPVGLVPRGFDVLAQRGGSLDERLAWAFEDSHARQALPTLLIGMDTPQVTPDLLTAAVVALLDSDGVLGPADDGGWWAVGLHHPDPLLFLGVPMSRTSTGSRQLQRLRARGIEPRLLSTLRDMDEVDDLAHVAAQMPAASRLARLAPRLVPVAATA